MALDLSKNEAWRAELYDEPQVLVYFKIESITDDQGQPVNADIDHAVRSEVDNWTPNICATAADFDDENRKKFSYASNIQDTDDSGVFFYQKAAGRWSLDFKTAMPKLKLKKIQVKGIFRLEDANPSSGSVEDWVISNWKVQYDIVNNPFSGDKKKLFCDDVTWKKTIGDKSIILVTRHGWREY